MSGFNVLNRASGHEFNCSSESTVLQAAISRRIGLRHGCGTGRCGACEASLVEGRVETPTGERQSGNVLLCRARPLTDLIIDAVELPWTDKLPVRRLPARVVGKQVAAGKTAVLTLRLPARETFNYRPGQYISIAGVDGHPRYFSLACADASDGLLELHIGCAPGGQLTAELVGRTKVDEILRFEGPYGDFGVPLEDSRPAILVAGGTGLAPLKAIVETAIKFGSKRRLSLYWGVRRPEDFYARDTVEGWPLKLAGLSITLVVSDGTSGDGWHGRRGFVHEAVLADLPDLRGMQVFACGSPAMIAIAKSDFIERGGLSSKEFFADTFSSRQQSLADSPS